MRRDLERDLEGILKGSRRNLKGILKGPNNGFYIEGIPE
jgi:hypothetical protein